MSDLISRQVAVDAIEAIPDSNWRSVHYANAIRNIPSAEPVHGEWVTAGHTNGLNGTMWAECSVCGSPGDLWDNYCRVCGAKMDGGVSNGDTD